MVLSIAASPNPTAALSETGSVKSCVLWAFPWKGGGDDVMTALSTDGS